MLKYLRDADYDYVVAGMKTGIPKLDIGFWNDITVGSSITFTNGKKEAIVNVTGKKFFQTIGDAWFSYKTVSGIHPVFPELDRTTLVSISDVNKYYEYDFPSVLVKEKGVVVVEFKLSENQEAENL